MAPSAEVPPPESPSRSSWRDARISPQRHPRAETPMLRALGLSSLLVASAAFAQDNRRSAPLQTVPRLNTLNNATSELVNVVDRFALDRQSLMRRYDGSGSPAQRARMREFYDEWRGRLREHDFDRLSQEGRVDYVLLDNYVQHALALLDRDARQGAVPAPLLPFGVRLLRLHDERRNLGRIKHAPLGLPGAGVAG